jgi:hypothetical protein
MRQQMFKSMLAGLTLTTVALSSYADPYYVCVGSSFTLQPGSGTFEEFEWKEGSTSLTPGSSGELEVTPSLAMATIAETKTYTFRVKDAAGCWSDPVDYTVIVLPKLTAGIVNDNTGQVYCSNQAVATSLTASSNFSDLTVTSGVSYGFTWSGTAGTASGSQNEKLAVATAGTFEVSVAYILPPANDGSKLDDCVGTATFDIAQGTAPVPPTITLQ